MPVKKRDMILANYYMTRELHTKIMAYAEEQEVSAAHVVREAVKKLLKSEGKL